MQTVRLRISDSIFKQLMWFLSRFNSDEIQVIKENDEFLSVKKYLHDELCLVEEGKAEFLSIEELENKIEMTIMKPR